MSITPAKVRARLHADATIIANLADRLPAAVAAATLAIVEPDRGSRAEDAGIRGKGWVTDPTGEAATSRTMARDDALGNLDDQLSSLALTLSLLTAFVERWNRTEVAATRCSGGRVVDEWSRPDCHEYVETYRTADGAVRERGHGLCVSCRKRRDRAVRDEGAAA